MSWLTADAGPAQLGSTDDPTQLVPGRPERVLERGELLAKIGSGLGDIQAGLSSIEDGAWTGRASEAFSAAREQDSRQWKTTAAAFTEPSRLIIEHGHTLRAAQDKAARAIELWRQGTEANQQAEQQHEAACAHAKANNAIPPTCPEPGAQAKDHARALVADARTAVRESAERLKPVLRQHHDRLPPVPNMGARMLAGAGDAVSGLVESAGSYLSGVGDAGREMAMGTASLLGKASHIQTVLHPAQTISAGFEMGAGLVHSVTSGSIVTSTVGTAEDWRQDPAAALGRAATNLGSMAVGGGAAATGSRVAMTEGRLAAHAVPDSPASRPHPDRPTAQFDEAGWETEADLDGGIGPAQDSDTPKVYIPSRDSPSAIDAQPGPSIGREVDSPTARPETHEHPGPDPHLQDPTAQQDVFRPNGTMPWGDESSLPLESWMDDGSRQPIDPPVPEHGPPDYSANERYEADQGALDSFNEAHPRQPGDTDWIDGIRSEHPEYDHLRDEEVLAVKRWTGPDHQYYNEALRDGDAEMLGQHDADIRCLASGLNKLPPYLDGPVMRGLDIPASDLPKFLEKVEPGQTFREPGFASADVNNPVSGNVEMVIESTKGKDISSLSPSEWHNEVLFGPGSEFRVADRWFDPDTDKWKVVMTDTADH